MSVRTASASRPHGVYRTRDQLFAIALGAGGTAGLLVLAVLPGKAEVVGYIFIAPWAYAAWRAFYWGVRVRDDGIIIGGFLTSRRVSWAEIERFTVESAGPYPCVGRLIRKDGKRPIVLIGIDAGRRPTKKSRVDTQAKVDLLNAELARRRGGAAP